MDTPAKRQREAQKRRAREEKARRKQMRKQGLLGQDSTGLFLPGEVHREQVNTEGSMQAKPPAPPAEEGLGEGGGEKQGG